MKTAELSGALLDFWIAKTEQKKPYLSVVDGQCRIGWSLDKVPCQSNPGIIYSPSNNWEQGGPLIERERINIVSPRHDYWAASPKDKTYIGQQVGETPLIAAMRAYVASKFGDQVPDLEQLGS